MALKITKTSPAKSTPSGRVNKNPDVSKVTGRRAARPSEH
jgi:hypothetical protein